MFEKYFTVTLDTFRSPLTHASRSTWGDPKTPLAPLFKGGTGKVPQFIVGFRGTQGMSCERLAWLAIFLLLAQDRLTSINQTEVVGTSI